MEFVHLSYLTGNPAYYQKVPMLTAMIQINRLDLIMMVKAKLLCFISAHCR